MRHAIGGGYSIMQGVRQMVVLARENQERVESTFNGIDIYADPNDCTDVVLDRWYSEGARRAQEHSNPEWIYNMRPNVASTRMEWAELWPDGRILPPHRNAVPIGWPDKPTPNTHLGTVWVRRRVRYEAWERSELVT